ncbi:MAG TPA: lamin tail domain-containing protein [Paludibacter sp.]|nr:MAG: hypothetical protein BWY08_00324 [Bacteroidetes bacterium ADurb.Bin174]HQB28457.1 lamin tail domain-containing protein [Paludibacter sp.]
MNKIIFLQKILLLLFLSLSVHVVNSQTASQSFGYDVGEYSNQTGTTEFLPMPVGSGTSFARAGAVAPNAPIVLATNPNVLMTEGSFARGVASSTTSVTKISPIVGYTASKEFYTSFKVLFGNAEGNATANSGTWVFSQGAGTMYANSNDFSGLQSFIALNFIFKEEGIIDLQYRVSGNWSVAGLTKTQISQGVVHTIEIIGNNQNSGTVNYTYNGLACTVSPFKFDLYINGELIGNELSKSQLADDTNIESLTFIGKSSTSNVANIFIDDVVVYNSVPSQIESTNPTIVVTEYTIPVMSATVLEQDEQTITVSGVNLTEDIALTVTGENASLFTLSAYSIPHTQGVVDNEVLTVTYKPTAIGTHSALLNLKSVGANDITRVLSGKAVDSLAVIVPDIIITEVYGGGGNSGATYSNDYIELYNTTDNPVDIGGWSVQYYTKAGDGVSSNVIEIPADKSIPARSHFLIQGAGGEFGDLLLTPDVISTINFAADGGKVILYTVSTPQTIDKLMINTIVENQYFKDYLPFGKEPLPIWGSTMTANPSKTRSAGRKKEDNVYVYTQNIGDDFETQVPSPQGSDLTTVNGVEFKAEIIVENGTVSFNAVAGLPVEIYNLFGQKIYSTITQEGNNSLTLQKQGVVILMIGNQIMKLML